MKKQISIRALLMIALLAGMFVAAGNDVYAQDRGLVGAIGGRDGGYLGSGHRDGGMLGSGTLTQNDGGVIGSGTATGAGTEDDGGGTIGSGTRSQIIGSGARTSSFYDTMMRLFGF